MAEERTTGGFYEPLKVVDIKTNDFQKPVPLFESYITKKVGPFEILVNHSQIDSYPKVKVKLGNKEYVLLFASYVGSIPQIYIPKVYLKILGKNIYSLRSILAFLFIFFLFIYIKFLEKFHHDKSIFIAMLLITFPLFGMEFLTTSFINHPLMFSLEIILIMRVKKIINESICRPSDVFLIFLLSGFLLHFHLLAGGVLLISMSAAFLIVSRNISWKLNPFSLIGGFFLFFLLIAPFFFISSLSLLKEVIFRNRPFSDVWILPINSMIYYLIGIFTFPSFFQLFLGKKFGTEYLLFSIPSGLILVSGFLGIIPQRGNEKFKKFIFITSLLYLILSIFADIRPYHINYILPLIGLYIPAGLQKLNFPSEKRIKHILTLGIFLNIFQIEMLRESINCSSFSLSLHREVAEYLIKNKIKKIHNFAGRYDYIFIQKEKIDVIDFSPFFFKNGITFEGLSLSLSASRGEIVLLESLRSAGFTTGINLEEVIYVANQIGLKINVLKKFPEKGKYELALVKVE
jgi:hypothetical protein